MALSTNPALASISPIAQERQLGDCVPPAQCTQMTQGNKGGNCRLLAGRLPAFGLLEE